MPVDQRALDDLTDFARIERASRDIEPWAEVLMVAGQQMTPEEHAWLVKLYNAYDDLGSAAQMLELWPNPNSWLLGGDRRIAGQLPIGGERRNLRGPVNMIKHLNSYANAVSGWRQAEWLREGFPGAADPSSRFDALMAYMRRYIWGTGRLAAFEWAEFAGKSLGLPVKAGNGCLWESSGPRESLERIYNGGERASDPQQLDLWAYRVHLHLNAHGVPLDWWDLETVICDFNVMRKGRYYPGKHIAMIREEIDGLPADMETAKTLDWALSMVLPEPWISVKPGADKALEHAYADTGHIYTPFGLVR